jgi:hypothetical protein
VLAILVSSWFTCKYKHEIDREEEGSRMLENEVLREEK